MRQVRPPRQHFPWRRPARPFLLRRDAVVTVPLKKVAADADPVTQRLAIAEHQIKPPFGGIDVYGAGGKGAGRAHHLARNRRPAVIGAAAAIIVAAATSKNRTAATLVVTGIAAVVTGAAPVGGAASITGIATPEEIGKVVALGARRRCVNQHHCQGQESRQESKSSQCKSTCHFVPRKQ